MITEIATITIAPEQAEAFEAAVAEAAKVLQAAEGSHSMALERVIETPGIYHLRVEWDSVEHHMEIFRNSEGFKQWRALAGPFFKETPKVAHTELVDRFF